MRLALASILLVALASAPSRAGDIVSTYSNVPIGAAEGFLIDGGPSGGFSVDGNFYNNSYGVDPTYGPFWSGWSFSNQTTASSGVGFGQFVAVPEKAPGSGNAYGVLTSYTDPNPAFNSLAYINLAAGRFAGSLDVTNVLYTALAISEGSGFNDPFKAGDYFTLTIQGFSGAGATGTLLNSVVVDLARFGTSLDLLSTWKTVDLTSLGASRSLNFVFSTNVMNEFGPAIPTYAAIDNFRTLDTPGAAATPEPATLAMLGLGVVGVAFARIGKKAKS